MKWAIEKNIWNDKSIDNLKKSLESLFIGYFEIDREQFFNNWELISKSYGRDVIFYGSIQIAEKIRNESNWIPGVFYAI